MSKSKCPAQQDGGQANELLNKKITNKKMFLQLNCFFEIKILKDLFACPPIFVAGILSFGFWNFNSNLYTEA
ncbi:MAG: hypothetical protein ABH952_03105 [Candidatus Omnitrophota bacterium]